MYEATFALEPDYLNYCQKLYHQALGCSVNNRAIMPFRFSRRKVTRLHDQGATLLFATLNWEAAVDFKAGTVTIKAYSSDCVPT